MPNHVISKMTVEGPNEALEVFIAEVAGETPLDFDKIIPESERCKQSAAGELENDGGPYWYEWRLTHWGTKWNCYEVQINRVFDTCVDFDFYTAWSWPEPIIKFLTKKYPDLKFSGNYWDEYDGSTTEWSLN